MDAGTMIWLNSDPGNSSLYDERKQTGASRIWILIRLAETSNHYYLENSESFCTGEIILEDVMWTLFLSLVFFLLFRHST